MDKKKTRSIGLKKAMFGDVNLEGGMPSAENLLQLGNTLKGTASFNTEEDSAQDFYSEENGSTPEESVLTEPGLKQVKLNLMEWDNETLKKVFGGTTKTEDVTVEGKTYSVEKFVAPKDMVTVEMAVRVISLYNVCIDIPRAQVKARFVWNLTRTDIAQIEITAKAMAPIGANDGPYEVYKLGEPKTEEGA